MTWQTPQIIVVALLLLNAFVQLARAFGFTWGKQVDLFVALAVTFGIAVALQSWGFFPS